MSARKTKPTKAQQKAAEAAQREFDSFHDQAKEINRLRDAAMALDKAFRDDPLSISRSQLGAIWSAFNAGLFEDHVHLIVTQAHR